MDEGGRKVSPFISVWCLTWVLVVELGLLNVASPAWVARQPIGMVTNAIGQVLVKGTDSITEISEGSGVAPLQEGDWVQTGVSSLVLLEVGSGMQVVMNESTEFLLISRWESEKGLTRILRLKQGEFGVLLKGGPIRVEVETAVGTVIVDQTPSQESDNRYLYGINPYGMSDTMPYRPPLEILPTEFDLVVSPEQTTTHRTCRAGGFWHSL